MDPAVAFLLVAIVVSVGAVLIFSRKPALLRRANLRREPALLLPKPVHNEGTMRMNVPREELVETADLLSKLANLQPGQSMWLRGTQGKMCLVEKLNRTSGAQYDSFMWKWTVTPAGPSMQEYTMEALCAQLSVQGFVRAN